jgi:hypothetical protein
MDDKVQQLLNRTGTLSACIQYIRSVLIVLTPGATTAQWKMLQRNLNFLSHRSHTTKHHGNAIVQAPNPQSWGNRNHSGSKSPRIGGFRGPATIATPNQFTVSPTNRIQKNFPTMRSPYQINTAIEYSLAYTCQTRKTSIAIRNKRQTGENISLSQLRKIIQNLSMGHPRSEPAQHIIDSNAHSADTRLPTSLTRLDRDDVLVVHGPTARLL